MDRDSVTRMYIDSDMYMNGSGHSLEDVFKFASAIAAAEREECAKVCESLFDQDDDSCNEAELCAGAIRARGES